MFLWIGEKGQAVLWTDASELAALPVMTGHSPRAGLAEFLVNGPQEWIFLAKRIASPPISCILWSVGGALCIIVGNCAGIESPTHRSQGPQDGGGQGVVPRYVRALTR